MRDAYNYGEMIFGFDDCETPVFELQPNGDILVKGKLITNDMELVTAAREFYTRSNFEHHNEVKKLAELIAQIKSAVNLPVPSSIRIAIIKSTIEKLEDVK